MGQHVLDVGGFNEFEAAPFDELEVASAQLDLQIEGVEAGAEQDGDLGQRHPGLVQLQDFLADKARLVAFAVGLNQDRPDAGLTAGEQVFGIALLGLQNDFVGQIQDRLGAAVILFQLDDFRAGKEVGKLEDIAHRCAPKAVDRLGVVADRHHVVVGVGQQPDDVGLEPVGVLVLIDHDVAEGV